MTTASYPSDYKETEAREFNPETNSGRELLRKLKGGATRQVQRAPGSGEKKVYSYPEKQGPSQITGDRFLIKCLEFEPPDDGTGLGLEIKNAVMASDAFFPFRDGIDKAASSGIAAIIQPGGSIKDEEVIAAANEHNIAMMFTGMRHFRH